jgi:parvulin-like peptidyl-prolyl isomerase
MVVVALWVSGIVGLIVFSGLSYAVFLRQLAQGRPGPSDWAEELRELLQQRGIVRTISLLVTRSIGPALCWAPWSYRICVPGPSWAKLAPTQRCHIMRHELAHFERADLWRLLFVRLLALPHWFNPCAWWAVHEITQSVEWACDQEATGRQPEGAVSLAKALIQLGVARSLGGCPVRAAGRSSLYVRIRRLILMNSRKDSVMKKVLILVVAASLVAINLVRIELIAKEPTPLEAAPARPDAPQAANAASQQTLQETKTRNGPLPQGMAHAEELQKPTVAGGAPGTPVPTIPPEEMVVAVRIEGNPDQSGKTFAARSAGEVSPASDQSTTKEAANTESKPTPAHGLAAKPNTDQGRETRGRAHILGRVGNDVVLTSDVLTGIDDVMAKPRIRIPSDEVAKQRAALVQHEVIAGIDAFNAHYLDPDPVKSMSLSQRGLINQLVRQQIDVKMIYQDFCKTVPKEVLPSIEENVNRHFEENQLKILMKRENVVSRADLENAFRAKGISLERAKRIFMEKIVAQQWAQEQLKPEGKEGNSEEKEVTHEEMLSWYNAHLKYFEQPAKARWEELMISFARHSNHDEAYAAVAALGNRVLAGASLADVAKSASEGPTARRGGLRSWIPKDSLSSEKLNQAIFTLPVGQLSAILESQSGYHIVRVVERRELTRTSFVDAQKKIKEQIMFEKRYKEWMEKLHAKYPVWTVFDNNPQEPKNSDDKNPYSKK